MKGENLIWVLIFLVYIVSVILKKARAGSKDGKVGAAKSRSGWKAKLDQYLTRIKQEMEASKREGPGTDTVWEELMQSEEDPLEPARVGASSGSIDPAIKKAESPKREPVIKKIAPETTVSAAYKKRPGSNELSFEIQDLKKAVIWSEILAPPIALRDN
jgi:hypothetical protein